MLADDDLRRAANWFSGLAYGRSERKTLNLGWTAIGRAVDSLSPLEPEQLSSLFLKHSDLGDWTGEALEGATRREPLGLGDVAQAFEEIRTAKGVAPKQQRLRELLAALDPQAARYVVKVLSGEMRIGVQEGIVEAALTLPHDLLLDGEVLAHSGDQVLPFSQLQRRLGRKVVSSALRQAVPLVFVAFDLLWADGEALLELPLRARRARLDALDLQAPFLLARVESASGEADLERIFAETRERGNEGLMLKDPDSAYSPGRRGMAWLKLKRPLATLDCVVTAVEWGHGKRRGVLSDYTFAVRDEEQDGR